MVTFVYYIFYCAHVHCQWWHSDCIVMISCCGVVFYLPSDDSLFVCVVACDGRTWTLVLFPWSSRSFCTLYCRELCLQCGHCCILLPSVCQLVPIVTGLRVELVSYYVKPICLLTKKIVFFSNFTVIAVLACTHCVLRVVFWTASVFSVRKQHISSCTFFCLFLLKHFYAVVATDRKLHVYHFWNSLWCWNVVYDNTKIFIRRLKTCCYWQPLILPFQSWLLCVLT